MHTDLEKGLLPIDPCIHEGWGTHLTIFFLEVYLELPRELRKKHMSCQNPRDSEGQNHMSLHRTQEATLFKSLQALDH